MYYEAKWALIMVEKDYWHRYYSRVCNNGSRPFNKYLITIVSQSNAITKFSPNMHLQWYMCI